jgi:hypothetical protein
MLFETGTDSPVRIDSSTVRLRLVSTRASPGILSPSFTWIISPGTISRLGLEYSYDGRLMAGLGRTSTQKLYDGFLKYKLLRQVKGGMPMTATLFASTNITAEKDPQKDIVGVDRYKYFSNRMSYVYQAMLGRKFSDRFSFQLSPTMVHYNLVNETTDRNDIFALIGLARLKMTERMAITGEYAWRANQYIADMKTYHDCVSLGIDIETGGHVFQIFVTNAYGINEVQTIPYTTGNPLKGDLRIGFNISRVFTL